MPPKSASATAVKVSRGEKTFVVNLFCCLFDPTLSDRCRFLLCICRHHQASHLVSQCPRVLNYAMHAAEFAVVLSMICPLYLAHVRRRRLLPRRNPLPLVHHLPAQLSSLPLRAIILRLPQDEVVAYNRSVGPA
jgi:hypothetical protein